ncbi:hypothetical protein CCP4SC76_5100001 [Gammaproteobacteria bacterium]
MTIALQTTLQTEIIKSDISTSLETPRPIEITLSTPGPQGSKGDKGDAGAAVIKRYVIDTPSLEWPIQHNMGTDRFMHALRDLDGRMFQAAIRIMDLNNFMVQLTSATSGHIDVLFGSV